MSQRRGSVRREEATDKGLITSATDRETRASVPTGSLGLYTGSGRNTFWSTHVYRIPAWGQGDQVGPERREEVQDMVEILDAIPGTHVVLESKMGNIMMEINHLRLILRKVAEMVTHKEGEVVML
ncbi:hypothetical protein NDU88_003962 [Pleurodeles waltl]|uniref:Uncharacterized protein n=1 Tax=Pleurodeles waltl TaxID=8319 RepID=A0AAV7KZZ6_PLEWA|nr:hypothetical protein NDU88_003962 [Pleurodeles waltl]